MLDERRRSPFSLLMLTPTLMCGQQSLHGTLALACRPLRASPNLPLCRLYLLASLDRASPQLSTRTDSPRPAAVF